MTGGTGRLSPVSELIEMHVFVTRFTFRRQPQVLNLFHPVNHRLFMTIRTFHTLVLPHEREFRLCMIKERHLPAGR